LKYNASLNSIFPQLAATGFGFSGWAEMEGTKDTKPEDNAPVVIAELFCPRCGSERLHRSYRDNAYERYVLKLIGVRPYRCESCNLRFLSRKKLDH
jgi:hypothetical protein